MAHPLAGPSWPGGEEGTLWWGDATLQQIHDALSPGVSAEDLTRVCDVVGQWSARLYAIADAHKARWHALALGSPDRALQSAYDKAAEIRQRIYEAARDLAELSTALEALSVQFVDVRTTVTGLYQDNVPVTGGDARPMSWLLLDDHEARDRAMIDATERARTLMQGYGSSASDVLSRWADITGRLATLDTPAMGLPAADLASAPTGVPPEFTGGAEADTVPINADHPAAASCHADDDRQGVIFRVRGYWSCADDDQHESIFVDEPDGAPAPDRGWSGVESPFKIDEQVAPPVIGDSQQGQE